MSTERLVLPGDLNLDARREFLTEAIAVIGSAATAGTEVELDCSAVESDGPVDDAMIGMLVVLARASQRQGARLVLVQAPQRMRAQFEAAGAARLFDWRG
jgi:anti-anti-sigma regulatory factor